jgi:hypothetical protein
MNLSHVFVKPKSSKAKNRLANMMQGDPICLVEQKQGDKWFLASSNRKYFFWVNLLNDENWEIGD